MIPTDDILKAKARVFSAAGKKFGSVRREKGMAPWYVTGPFLQKQQQNRTKNSGLPPFYRVRRRFLRNFFQGPAFGGEKAQLKGLF
jgi:hypothetical protein